jgi:hypothetical protein
LKAERIPTIVAYAAPFGPVLWRFRERLNSPQTLAPAIPEGPSICCLAVAFAWRWFKDAYWFLRRHDLRDDPFYRNFVEQINEQKELLVAMTLYALYRVAAVTRTRTRFAPSRAAGSGRCSVVIPPP